VVVGRELEEAGVEVNGVAAALQDHTAEIVRFMCPSALCSLGLELSRRYWGSAFRRPHNSQSELSHFIKS
jgi:hypothetical protein